MERLKLAYLKLQQTVKTWEEAFLHEQKVISMGMSLDFERAAHDSLIQRFRYCYDSFWKCAQRYLESRHNIIDINSPKAVFRALTQQKICSFEEGELLIDMSESRNETAHRYGLEMATEQCAVLKEYYTVIAAIMGRFILS